MPRKLLFCSIMVVFLMGLLAWAPWLTHSFAEARAVNAFNEAWSAIIDGCGTNCQGCGAVSSQRVPFGMKVTLEYGCGLMPEDSSEYHERSAGFVSAFGTVHGFPRP